MSDIERELESELHRVLDPLSAEPVPARRAAPSRATRTRALVGGAGAAVTFKLLSGAVAAAAAVTFAGAATTGSFNPGDWGQQVTQRVQACRDRLADGQHGLGDCVGPFASSHGQSVASDARHHGQDNGNGATNAHGNNSNANDHARDRSKDHPQATPKGNNGGDDAEPTDPPIHPTVTIPPQH
jgi:anti-sigma factor RsiW